MTPTVRKLWQGLACLLVLVSLTATDKTRAWLDRDHIALLDGEGHHPGERSGHVAGLRLVGLLRGGRIGRDAAGAGDVAQSRAAADLGGEGDVREA